MDVQRVFGRSALEVEGWVRGEFFSGIADAVIGLSCGARRLQAVAGASRRLACFAVTFSMVSFLILWIVWVMLLCIVGVLMGVLAIFNGWQVPWHLQLLFDALSFRYVLRTLVFIVPQCVIMFLRYWAYKDQDIVFLSALRQEVPGQSVADQMRLTRLADALEELPAESSLAWLRKYATAVATNGSLALVLLLLSTLPTVGPIILQAALLAKKRHAIGLVPALILMVLAVLPSSRLLPAGRVLAMWGFQLILTARSTSKELLYTMTGRCSHAQRQALSTRHQARIVGFGVVAGTVLSVPVVGPLLWFDLVKVSADVFGKIVRSEEEEVFDLVEAVTKFREEQARRKAEEEARAREREERAQARREEQERRAATRQQDRNTLRERTAARRSGISAESGDRGGGEEGDGDMAVR